MKEDEEQRNKDFLSVLTNCYSFLTKDDIVSLRCTNRALYDWSFQSDIFIYFIKNANISSFHIYNYWIQCIQTHSLPIEYNDVYERLRSYGIGEHFIRTEGVIGDISRDVSRTFPTHSLFQSTAELGQQMLENVLRCVSEYFPNIGYCQGMNFVVAVILIALIDPEGKGFSSNSEEQKKMFQYVIMESQTKLEKQTFAIILNIIKTLHMEGLWSSGIPELKRFIFILQEYMKQFCPALLDYFDDVGYDVSIIVSKWFITLFAYTLPFPLLFKFWGYIIRYKWPGVIRITIALLLFFEESMVSKDIVELSIMMKDIRETYFQTAEDQNQLYSLLLSLNSINEETYEHFNARYDQEINNMTGLLSDYVPSVDRKEKLEKQKQITRSIDWIRGKLEGISERELTIKQEYHRLCSLYWNMNEEVTELEEFKRNLLQQVESLLYLDQHNLFDPSVKVEEMTRISFMRQQDIRVLCDKVKVMSEQIKKKQEAMWRVKVNMDGEKQKWEVLLKEKNVLKEELMEVVKQQTNLLK